VGYSAGDGALRYGNARGLSYNTRTTESAIGYLFYFPFVAGISGSVENNKDGFPSLLAGEASILFPHSFRGCDTHAFHMLTTSNNVARQWSSNFSTAH